MSNTTLKILIVIMLSIILFPVGLILIVSIFSVLLGRPSLFIEMLLMILPTYFILVYFDKKQKRYKKPKSKLDSRLDNILKVYFGMTVVYSIYVLPSVILQHPRRMMFFFLVVLPACAIYIKCSQKKDGNAAISNFKKKGS